MAIEIQEVHEEDRKSEICNAILRALPNWFGNEPAIVDYTNQVKGMPFLSAFVDEEPIGFLAVKEHNQYTAEVCVMGVLTDYHRQGIGRKLIQRCEEYCVANEKEFLTVKTLDESRASKSYEKTRQFYLALGFKPLEVFPLYWDKDNPCLFMVKSISHP
jgi:GNAT superfamily N-acetyltransferase